MHIGEIQQKAEELCRQQNWRDRSPSQRFRYLISEIGELSAELIHLEGESANIDRKEIKRNIGHEIYDVVWNLCDLANQLEIDLEQAFAEKQAINRTRRWP